MSEKTQTNPEDYEALRQTVAEDIATIVASDVLVDEFSEHFREQRERESSARGEDVDIGTSEVQSILASLDSAQEGPSVWEAK